MGKRKKISEIWNREEGKYVLWVREKIHGETVLEVGGNQSLVGLCEMGFVVYRGVKSVAGFCDGKEEQ